MSAKILASLLLASFPAAALAAWQMIATEQGRRVEIDRESILRGENAALTARGRIVFEKPIIDPKTSLPYSVIEVESRYDCGQRAYATLKRTFYKEDGSLLRQDEVGPPTDMLVRSGTPDDRLLREVCRPSGAAGAPPSVAKTLEKIDKAAGDLRKSNAALVERAAKKPPPALPSRRFSARAPYPAPRRADAARDPAATSMPRRGWSYEGDTGPAHWSELSPEYAVCANGQRQSPIDLRESFAVDLEPIEFRYPPVPFRVNDAGPYLQLMVPGGGFQLSGQDYRLTHVVFHNPSEFLVAGKGFDMEAQLFHRADDGRQAIVSVLLEAGANENPLVQAALNNLPLEKGGENVPPGQTVDINQLLPDTRAYFTFMGSLTTPPCAEEILWLVLKPPRTISAEQLTMFQRLYRPNARPPQPVFGRIIKESRR